MQLIQCIASQSGLFNNLIIDFKDKINIIYGESGSGKTLLITSILSTIANLLSTELFGEQHTNKLNLNITFVENSIKYRLIRGNKQIEISSDQTPDSIIITEQMPLDQRKNLIREFSPELCSFLTQADETAIIHSSFITSPVDYTNKKFNYSDIAPLLINDESGYYNHYISLNSFLKSDDNALAREHSSAKRALKELDHEVEIRNLRISKFSKIDCERQDYINEQRSLKKQRDSLKKTQSVLISLQEKFDEIELLQSKKSDLDRDYCYEKEKIQKVNQTEEKLEREYPLFNKLDDTQMQSLPDIRTTFTILQDVIAKITRKNERKEKIYKKVFYSLVSTTLLALLLSLLLFFILPPVTSFVQNPIIAALLLGANSIVILIGIITVYLNAKRNNTDELIEQKQYHDKQLVKMLKHNTISIGQSSSTELYELIVQFFQEYNSFDEMRSEIDDLSKTITPDFEQAYDKKSNLAVKKILKEQALFLQKAKQTGIALDSVDQFCFSTLMSENDQKISDIEENLSKCNELLRQIDSELSLFSNETDINNTLTEERAKKERELQIVEKRITACTLVKEILEKTIQTKEINILKSFTEQAFRLYSTLQGKSNNITIDEFAEWIHGGVPTSSSPVTSHYFSLATVLALSDFIKKSTPCFPLFADEPATYMDKKKIDILLPGFKKISENRQVILLTHNINDFKSAGHRVTITN